MERVEAVDAVTDQGRIAVYPGFRPCPSERNLEISLDPFGNPTLASILVAESRIELAAESEFSGGGGSPAERVSAGCGVRPFSTKSCGVTAC